MTFELARLFNVLQVQRSYAGIIVYTRTNIRKGSEPGNEAMYIAVSQKLSSRTLASVYIFAVEATGRARPGASMDMGT